MGLIVAETSHPVHRYLPIVYVVRTLELYDSKYTLILRELALTLFRKICTVIHKFLMKIKHSNN
jgi:hypothetical protein